MNNTNLLLIFDFDGVISNSKDAYAKQMKETVEILAKKDIPDDFFRKRVGNTDQEEDFYDFLKTKDEKLVKEAMALYSNLTPKYEHLRTLFPNVKETLRKLKEDNYITIVSRKSQKRMEYWLHHFSLSRFIDDAIGTVEKTKAFAIKTLMKKFNITKERTVMVGDTEFDIRSAKEVGVISVAALYDCTHRDLILSLNPDFTINKFEEIVMIVSKIKDELGSKFKN
ncbi:MAG: HAD family hydrolase [Candidatus Heimdallarchaeaceae archaeon]